MFPFLLDGPQILYFANFVLLRCTEAMPPMKRGPPKKRKTSVLE